MNRKNYSFFIACSMFAAMLAIACHEKVEQQDSSATKTEKPQQEKVLITVRPDKVVNPGILGFGWNISVSLPQRGSTDLQVWNTLVVESGQSFIRLVLHDISWEERNDDDNPRTLPEDFTFPFVNNGLNWAIQNLLDLCEQNDIEVEINKWNTRKEPWMELQKGENDLVSKDEYMSKAREFAENVASFLYYLKTSANRGKGYNCVKYYGLWNESMPDFPMRINEFDLPGSHNMIHKLVREQLEFYDQHCGTFISDSLQSMAVEGGVDWRNSYYGKPSAWHEMLGQGYLQYLEQPNNMPGEITDWPSGDPYMDFISHHEYNSVFDYDAYNPSPHNHGTLSSRFLPLVKYSMEQIRQYDMDQQVEPFLVNELGAHAIGHEELEPDFSHNLFCVEAFVRSLNLGLKGGSLWNLSAHKFYASISFPYCWWGEDEPFGEVHPIAENYYAYQLFCRNARRGDNVLETEVTGGKDKSKGQEYYTVIEAQRVFCTALEDALSVKVFVVNDSYVSKQISILGLISSRNQISKTYVSAETYMKGITEEILPAGKVEDDIIPARSVSVYIFSK